MSSKRSTFVVSAVAGILVLLAVAPAAPAVQSWLGAGWLGLDMTTAGNGRLLWDGCGHPLPCSSVEVTRATVPVGRRTMTAPVVLGRSGATIKAAAFDRSGTAWTAGLGPGSVPTLERWSSKRRTGKWTWPQGAHAFSVVLAVSPGGNVLVAWPVGGADGAIFAATHRPRQAWKVERIAAAAGDDNFVLSAAIDDRGSAAVTFQQAAASGRAFRELTVAVRDGDARWQTSGLARVLPDSPAGVRVALNAGGALLVSWINGFGSPEDDLVGEVYAAYRPAGGPLGTPVLLDSSTQFASYPVPIPRISDNGDLLVGWNGSQAPGGLEVARGTAIGGFPPAGESLAIAGGTAPFDVNLSPSGASMVAASASDADFPDRAPQPQNDTFTTSFSLSPWAPPRFADARSHHLAVVVGDHRALIAGVGRGPRPVHVTVVDAP